MLLTVAGISIIAIEAQVIDNFVLNVVDQNGDAVTQGTVSIRGREISRPLNISLSNGGRIFLNLEEGEYSVEVVANGFDNYRQKFKIKKGLNSFTIELRIKKLEVGVDVQRSEREKQLDDAFSGHLSEEEIAALPENGEDIREELKRRYGDDITIRIDGDFSGSQIPPRDQIASIKIVRNTFDAEFHEIAQVLIDIRTKVVANGFHGLANFSVDDSRLGSRDPFDTSGESRRQLKGIFFLSGPIIAKTTSFNLAYIGSTQSKPQNFIGLSPFARDTEKIQSGFSFGNFSVKHSLPKEHLLSFIYKFSDFEFDILGPFDLPARKMLRSNPSYSFAINESGAFAERYYNDFRIDFAFRGMEVIPESDVPTTIVLNSFNIGSGGAKSKETEWSVGIFDNVVFDHKNHSLKAGGQLNFETLSKLSQNNLNGRYIYSNIADFEDRLPLLYSKTLLPTSVSFFNTEISLYFQDYFKVSRNLQISLGARYEFQSFLNDKNNLSPRIGIVWAPEQFQKLVFRFGAGIFFDWLDSSTRANVLSRGLNKGEMIVIRNPAFPDPLNGGVQIPEGTVGFSEFSENLRTPSVYAAQFSALYKLNKTTSIEGTYTFKRGLHLFRSRDINAPIDGLRPNPEFSSIRSFESGGSSFEHRINVKFNKYYKGINFYGIYDLTKAESDFDNSLSLPSNSLNIKSDWGPIDFNQFHKIKFSADLELIKLVKLIPSIRIESGFPYTITTGRDENGDSVVNDRPSGIGRNSETGEWQYQADIRIEWKIPREILKSFGVEKHRVSIYSNVQNIFNTNNFTNFVGVKTSPFFGQPSAAQTPRSIELGFSFSF